MPCQQWPTRKASGWYGDGAASAAVDIGPKTAARLAAVLGAAKTILWTGAIGVSPSRSTATTQLVEALTAANAFKLILGDIAASALNDAPVKEGTLHVSAGSSASLALLQGHRLPGVEALRDPQWARGA